MSYQTANGQWFVWLTFLLGLIFQLMPLPEMVAAFRPDWLLMITLYWLMALPNRYNIFTAFFMGLLLDIMLGSNLGVHALAFTLISYGILLNFQRLRNFPIWQQTSVIVLFIGLYHLLLFWMTFVLSDAVFQVQLFSPTLASILLWPWLFLTLRRFRRRYKVR